MKLQFLGANLTVTGSKTLLHFQDKKILIDCGLFQGPKFLRELNWKTFSELDGLDAVVLTHAHLDHSGFLPRLVKEGYRGPIYCSPGTADLVRLLLLDSAHLQEEDAEYANRSQHSHHRPALPLYTVRDAEIANQLLAPTPRNQWEKLVEGLSFQLLRSGHIIGSSFVQFSCHEGQGGRIITFSGDIGNGRSSILKPPVSIPESDYLIVESTYGNRKQERNSPLHPLANVVNKVIGRGGVLLIPAFAVGRTQEILFLLRQLEEKKLIPDIPVYLDSPMAIEATKIFLNHPEDQQLILNEDNFKAPLSTRHFHTVTSPEESMALCESTKPMIVVSASGMLSGGRILHHLKARIEDTKNGILFIGYQAEETKGRRLIEGMSTLRIHHQEKQVRAEVFKMDHLSAHADAEDILQWLSRLQKAPKEIFINHGEKVASQMLAEAIHQRFGYKTHIPQLNELVTLL